jgi:transcriptional regulator
MHPNRAFHMHDQAAMQAIVADRAFGMLFARTGEGLRVAHAPVLVESEDRLVFHLARNNPVAQTEDGSDILFVCNGPDGYISPDWYEMPDQVPTWNYQAVELSGTLHRLPEGDLPGLIERLSADHERRLHPKPAWHHGKMRSGLFDQMLKGIIGFRMAIREWRATSKLSQNKPREAQRSAAARARAHGNGALADLMEADQP